MGYLFRGLLSVPLMDLPGVRQKHDKRITQPPSRTSHFLARAFVFAMRLIMFIVHIDHSLLPLSMVSGYRLLFLWITWGSINGSPRGTTNT